MPVFTCGSGCSTRSGVQGCSDSQVTWEGKVLSTGEYNGYDDSDFYAEVWVEDAGSIKRVVYATTRGWTYHNGATVDATDEVKAAAAAYEAARRAVEVARIEAEEAKAPRKGRTVKVVKGRKVPVGTVAEVFWYGPDRYAGRSVLTGKPHGYRVGLDIDGERVFTNAANVEVVTSEEVAA